MCTVWRGAAVAAYPHAGGAEVEHALNAEAAPLTYTVAIRIEKLIPAVIDGEQQFCRARNKHPP